MEAKRARRRRDLARMKAKAVRVYGHFWTGEALKRQERLANHLAHCSSYCCGNPRKWFGEITMQERRFLAEPVE